MTWTPTDIAELLTNPDGFWQSYCSNDAGSVIGTRSHIIDGFGLTRAQSAYPAGHAGVDNLRCVLRRLAEMFPMLDHRTTGARYGQGALWEPAMPPGWLPRNFTLATVALGRFTGTLLRKPTATDHSELPRLFVFMSDGKVHLALDCLESVDAAWHAGHYDLWLRRYRKGDDGLLITRVPVSCIELDDGQELAGFLKTIYATLPMRLGAPAIYPSFLASTTGAKNHAATELDNEPESEEDAGEGEDPWTDSTGDAAEPVTCPIYRKSDETPLTTAPATVFETLYDLALDIRTNPHLGHLTNHSTNDRARAEADLQRALLSMSTVLPPCSHRWDIVRAFTLNFLAGGLKLTNNFRHFVNDQLLKTHSQYQMKVLNNPIPYLISHLRIAATNPPKLAWQLAGADFKHIAILADWIDIFTAHTNPSINCPSWLDWVIDRKIFWAHKIFAQISIDDLKLDIMTFILLPNNTRRFPGMGFALGANFFADIGIVWFTKPDLHVNGILRLLGLLARDGDADERNFDAIIELTRIEARTINLIGRFHFLRNIDPSFVIGDNPAPCAPKLYPRQMDRLIYLIGSDNHLLNGNKNRRQSKVRHQLMVERLVQAGILGAAYWRRI